MGIVTRYVNMPTQSQAIIVFAASLIVAISANRMALAQQEAASKLDAVFASHCFQCHGDEGEVNGQFDLRSFGSVNELLAKPALLAKVVQVVRDGEMPPPGDVELKDDARQAFLQRLESWLGQSLREYASPPRTPVRRMNRFQYGNAVVDLLDLNVALFSLPECICRDFSNYFQPQTGEMPQAVKVGNRALGKSQLIAPRLSGVVPFPQDPKASNGFDNRADLLTISPVLMESFLELSRSIFNSPDFGPKTCRQWKTYFEPPVSIDPALEIVLRQRLEQFLTAAFRQPVDAETLDRYARFATERLNNGDDFTTAMKAAAIAALTSPRFLYLGDSATTGKRPEAVSDIELASRMSFFLWSSGPDDELLSTAIEGRLADDKMIAEHADRMMNSPRMKRFCDAFASQWLRIEHLISSEPDHRMFPDFYKFGTQSGARRGSVHLMLEPLLVFETVFVENRSIDQFIHSDFSYRSKQVTEFLTHSKTYSNDARGPSYAQIASFERVPITSKREGGVITTAAVLAMTSGPTETKPITRGKWIVETLFNNPPPPPPANVPDLAEAEPDKAKVKTLMLREKFALHRTRSDCASCHAKIDPFGFALENYDPIGRWRDTDATGRPIDAGGKLFNRLSFDSIEQFKDALLTERERFARGFAGHLLKYALGRELDPTDQPALDRIVSASAADDFRLRGMMKQVILSEPFRMKFNPSR